MSKKAIIFSAPSGSGKTTLVKHLLDQNLPLKFSVSATSRACRGNEADGKDYHFLSQSEFDEKVENDEFIEWEEVYPGTSYGTLKSEINRIWESGNAVIFDVDVIGGLNLKKFFGDKALAIFVKPPSIAALSERLRYRATESEEKIQMRIAKASSELEKDKDFDTIILNDDLAKAKNEAFDLVNNFIAG